MIYTHFIKPSLDAFTAFIVIVGAAPLWLFGFAVVRFSQSSPIFYVQRRTGYKMRGFNMYKIRTLEPAGIAHLTLRKRKYTRFGKLMRRSGFDELPQLFNILLGQMSFVGPRPLPVAYEGSYKKKHLSRFNCKPGLSGWAQVNGRNAITWKERFEMDDWYCRHVSFWLDLRILFRTIIQMRYLQSVEKEMPVFKGNKTA
jgi:lipopolysaccharide/colanic/teichoic acid biosynthesis glycosyltransferase